jgi:arginine/ornithine N-succinyltransferase beta subunit
MSAMIVRPATADDLPALLALAHSAGTGLTTWLMRRDCAGAR